MHGQGLVFIRQLLPTEHMSSLLASMNASEEFIALACQLIVVLHQVTGGNYMSRRYLMNECRHFLTTQKELNKVSFKNIKRSEAGEVTSRLAEFCASEEYSDEDIPGGLWGNTSAGDVVKRNSNTPIQHQTPKNGRKPKTWAVAYTKKILEQNDKLNPAYSQYRHYPLLSERIERISQNPSSWSLHILFGKEPGWVHTRILSRNCLWLKTACNRELPWYQVWLTKCLILSLRRIRHYVSKATKGSY